MTVLLLRLAGPMQSWGDSSRFTRRDTRMVPSKSGVLGLLAAADGRRRTDPIEDLTRLRFGVRVDQPGHLQKDFQTAINTDTGKSMPLSYRYYVADAVFLAGVEGDRSLLEALAAKVQAPEFPLYLGRRSCPVVGKVFCGLEERLLEEALSVHEWLASQWYRRTLGPAASLELYVDACSEENDPVETHRDVPISYNPVRREYGWREVAHRPPIEIPNPSSRRATAQRDWLTVVEEA